jgi:hypothetical protein
MSGEGLATPAVNDHRAWHNEASTVPVQPIEHVGATTAYLYGALVLTYSYRMDMAREPSCLSSATTLCGKHVDFFLWHRILS